MRNKLFLLLCLFSILFLLRCKKESVKKNLGGETESFCPTMDTNHLRDKYWYIFNPVLSSTGDSFASDRLYYPTNNPACGPWGWMDSCKFFAQYGNARTEFKVIQLEEHYLKALNVRNDAQPEHEGQIFEFNNVPHY
jgi:hypothetical protein